MMNAILCNPRGKQFRLRTVPLMVSLALLLINSQLVQARSNETTAAFTATQLVRQFTLKNTVAQVNQGMQGYVVEVNGQLRGEAMGATPTNYPVGMGSVPATVNLPQRDGAGRPLGYCAWDNTSAVSSASFLAGSGVASPLMYAVISPGLNGAIETTCAEILATRLGNGDDYVLATAPTQSSSRQFRSSVGSEAELFAMTGENGDVRLVTDTNRLYSYQNGSWTPIGGGSSTFSDDSAANGAGAISYTTGKVTVADFQATVATINSGLTVGGAASLNGGMAVTGDSSIAGNLAVTGTVSSTSGFSGNGALLTDLNASAINSGVLGIAQGGTGVTGVPLQGQLLIGTGAGYTLGGITGTANQVSVNYAAGNLAISLPQDIAATSTPTFGGLTVNGNITAGRGIFSDAVSAERLDVGTLAGGVSSHNMAVGVGALMGTQSGMGGNTAVGPYAMYFNTTGYRNVAIGSSALISNTTGYNNTAVGYVSLQGNTTGDSNTAIGYSALTYNTTGNRNTAIGQLSMVSNTTGSDNTAVGRLSLYYNTTGLYNTTVGEDSMFANTTGSYNTALGQTALTSNQTGEFNVAVGQSALMNNTSSRNSALGQSALRNNSTGIDNTGIGQFALGNNTTGTNNTALGQSALSSITTGRYSTALGQGANVLSGTLNYANALGAGSRVATSNTFVLGALAASKDAGVSTTDDQVVIGSTSRNDTQTNTKLYVNGTVNIASKLFVNGVEVTAGSNTNASNINSGTLGTAYGGTGVNGSTAANGQLLIGNGSGYTLSTLTGTANQINVTNGSGSITLSLPQSIATNSSPTFGGMTLNGAITGTTANFSGRVDVGSLYVAGAQVQALTKTNIDAALTYASDTGDVAYDQPNLVLGAGALASSKRAANVAIGASVMGMLTADPNGAMGVDNTGVGYRALYSASTGYRNTALGARAAHNLTTGYANTAVGRGAGYGINSGYENTALGENALFNAASSYQNIAIGKNAMLGSNSAYSNVSIGNNSMQTNTSGYDNVAVGRSAMNLNTTGYRNTGVGLESLRVNSTGSYNMGLGYRADVTTGALTYAQAVGNMSQVATSNTMVLGALGANKFGSTTTDQIVIGATSRNDTETNTVLYVSGNTNLNGNLYASEGTFNGRLKIVTGSSLQFGDNVENLDTTTIYRFNEASDQTRLRVRLGDNVQNFGSAQGDEFQIGYENGGYMPTFRVAGSGSVISSGSVTATAFNTSSDRRLKADLRAQNADDLLNKLTGLQAYSYEYVGKQDLGRRIGVIAQDMLPLFPEVVSVRPDGFYAVDYGALGALAASGVGRLNERVNNIDKVLKDNNSAQTIARIDTLEGTVTEHGQRIAGLETWRTSTDKRLVETDARIGALESWKTTAVDKMDSMQSAIDLNIQKIADHAVAIQANTKSIERLDDALFTLDGRVKNNTDLINNLNARWAQNFSASEDGSLLTVNAVELKVSNFTAQNMRANSVYAQRIEAEMARIAELEVNNLRANSAVANSVQAEQVNTGSAQVYAGVGLPAILFAARSDGHYTVNTSALDGSYATATVIVNAGQAKVIAGAKDGIELYAEGNVVKAIAAGKSIRASWIKTG